MEFTENKFFNKRQRKDIIAIWNQEYPKKLELSTMIDFEDYLNGLKDKSHIILTDETDAIKGWLVYFIREGNNGSPCSSIRRNRARDWVRSS